MQLTYKDKEMIAWIDSASLYDLLKKWRFSSAKDPLFHGDIGDYYIKVMFGKRNANPELWSAVSKQVGWGKED
jgi:hypothetical protein